MRRVFAFVVLASCSSATKMPCPLETREVNGMCVACDGPICSSADATIADGASDAGMDATSAAACAGPGNIFHLEGEPQDPVHPGVDTLGQTGALWGIQMREGPLADGGPDLLFGIGITATPVDGQATMWSAQFSSQQLGTALGKQPYFDVQRFQNEQAGHAGLAVNDGDSTFPCGTVSGSFTIHELQRSGPDVTLFVASFEQHCDGGPALRGCVRWKL